jgi:hypothetical protein
MSRMDRERALRDDRGATIQAARQLVDDVEEKLAEARRLRRYRQAVRIVRKTWPTDYFY